MTKFCSTCNRTYTDPDLSFCIDDGTPLSIAPEDESTVVSPRANANAGDNEQDVQYRQPGSYVPPVSQVSKRRVWPWVVGVLGAFVLGIIAISIAAAFLAPRLMRSQQVEQANVNVETANANRSENVNVAEPPNSNSNANEEIDIPPPKDHDQVLVQLRDLENDWTVANLNADKNKLELILADDYVGPSEAGGPRSKAEYIRTIRRNVEVEKWEFRDLRLMLVGDRATLSGTIVYVIQDEELVLDFKDKFVWRDGRWQATGSEVNQKQ